MVTKEKKRKYPRSMTMVTLLLFGMGLLLWIVGMCLVTALRAEMVADKFISAYANQASMIAEGCFDDLLTDSSNQADLSDGKSENNEGKCFLEAVEHGLIDNSPAYNYGVYGDTGFLTLAYPVFQDVYSATAIYDTQGNCIEKSWEDFYLVEYYTEEDFENNGEISGYVKVPFEREFFVEELQEVLDKDGLNREDVWISFADGLRSLEKDSAPVAMRITGEMDENHMIPVTIEYEMQSVTNSGTTKWIKVYESKDAVSKDAQLVTVYSSSQSPCCYVDAPAFTYEDSKYDGVDRFVAYKGPKLKKSPNGYNEKTGEYTENFYSRYEGLNLILCSVSYCMEKDGQRYFTSNAHEGEEGGMKFYIVNAISFSLWRYVFSELHNFYLITLLITIVTALVVRRVIRKQLVRPVTLVGEALSEDREWLRNYKEKPWKWQEGHLLEQVFESDRERKRQISAEKEKLLDEIKRLTKALDYAKEAEENRRQLTSNIAHELKTPLAVIHSYTEGLQERIAEEKRDKYLNVIMSETERMDAMVLEMLDLSRLEAGRVKISRVEVSLANVAKMVFEKLDRAIEAKNLHVEYYFSENSVVKADEMRIGQVIENFATNAVKYTPINGNIRVIVRSGRVDRTFAIVNDSEPLDEEALEKIWDTFYRVDESRSTKGTGLGLAIAKNIIELHGGRCYAKNTDTGVEFGFIL